MVYFRYSWLAVATQRGEISINKVKLSAEKARVVLVFGVVLGYEVIADSSVQLFIDCFIRALLLGRLTFLVGNGDDDCM